MAAKANNVVPIFFQFEDKINSETTQSESIATNEKTELTSEQSFKHSDIDLFLTLLEDIKKMPDHFVDEVSTMFKGLRGPKQEFAANDIAPRRIEDLPIISEDLHQGNLSCLDDLRMINPETEEDIDTITIE